MKVVIIGGVAAGATTAARLRRLKKDIEIVIYERGNYISYANCGLPYYIGNVIKNRDALLLNNPKLMKDRFNIDVYVNHEVLAILKDSKELVVFNKEKGIEEKVSYDKLIIATGSSPIVPNIPGINNSRIVSLWTVPDTDTIKSLIKVNNVKKALVIGGGFIGIEMLENLANLGIEVSLVEKSNQILGNLDKEMAKVLEEHLKTNGVKLVLGKGALAFRNVGEGLEVSLDDNTKLITDLVILAIGVKPNSMLASNAGILTNNKGGIIVDSKLRTSENDIYALGDVATVKNFVSNLEVMIPLAGPANKQGRILADILGGLDKEYKGSQGTSILKVFEMSGGSTGLNEKQLKALNLVKHVDYEEVMITQNNHAGYYPNATPLYIKMLFDLKTGFILGAQVVGFSGVDKRIDILSTAQRLKLKAWDLQELELAYAPPFSSAKDPINMLGYVAENVVNGLVKLVDVVSYYDNKDEYLTLDVRENKEREQGFVEGSVHIPYGELRKRFIELDKNKKIAIYCAIGVRAYNAARILMQNGFEEVYVIMGGYNFQRIYEKK